MTSTRATRGGFALLALVLLAVVLLAVGAWLFWPRISVWTGRASAETSAASPDLAETALDRFEAFRAGKGGDRLTLSDAEISSVVRYAIPGLLPSGVSDPEVTMKEGHLSLAARVATAAFPKLPSLDGVIGMLPDTVPVRMDGELVRFGKESLSYRVEHIEAARIPLPDRMIPGVLSALGRTHKDGLPANALHLPLPSGLDSVSVRGDSLVLVADR
jgi:hypothetical protein